MKIACEIIQDLLPLYAEKICSKQSEELVEEHIAECGECKAFLEMLTTEVNEPDMPTISHTDSHILEALPLKNMRKSIFTRKMKAVALGVLILFFVMFATFSHLTTPQYISFQKSEVSVFESENGKLYVNFARNVTAYKTNSYTTENGKYVVEIEAWTSVWDNILGKSTPSVCLDIAKTPVDAIYYCDYTVDDNMQLIYGENPYGSGGVVVLPRLVLGYYIILGFILAIILAVCSIIMRKNKKARIICKCILLAAISYLLSGLILGTDCISFSATRDFCMNIIAAVALYGIIVLGLEMYHQHKKDKSEF